MQTFLPYEDFVNSASCLDRARLGKQRSEVITILKALIENNHWINHPAVKMWRGYIPALVRYGLAICDEWISRGYKDTCRERILAFCSEDEIKTAVLPPWLGDIKFHNSHRSNLLRKDPIYYGQFNWNVPTDLPYVWPGDTNESSRVIERVSGKEITGS